MVEDAHILVVDDDARLRALLSRYLAGEGFRVTTAETATEARDKLRFMHPDMLVLDVMMPGESGLTLTESLRREQGSEMPVLLLTARGAPEDRIAGFEAGADDYLGKPFEPRELVLRIRALLRRAPAQPETPQGPARCAAIRRRARRTERTGWRHAVDRRRGRIADRAGAQPERGAVTRGDCRDPRYG
jgi:two-component system phosphate regulon response regulator OmpR